MTMPSDQRSASGPQCRMNISGGRNSGVPVVGGALSVKDTLIERMHVLGHCQVCHAREAAAQRLSPK